MTTAAQIALTATPLAAYLYTIGLFHGSSRPRVIPGRLDFGLLAVGVGGLVAYGPFGQAFVGRVAGANAGWTAWLAWTAVVGVWALALAAGAGRRVAIYNVGPAELDRAMVEALSMPDWRFEPTLDGYEDVARRLAVRVKASSRFHAGSVEARGQEPEAFLRAILPRLRSALARQPRRPSPVSHALFAGSCLVMLAPMVGYFMAYPRAREALRALMQGLRWW
jgi:hypothetical protein